MLDLIFDLSNFKYFEGAEFSRGLHTEDWITVHKNTVNGFEYYHEGEYGIPFGGELDFEEDSLLVYAGDGYPSRFKRIPYDKVSGLIGLHVKVKTTRQLISIVKTFDKYNVDYYVVNPESGEILLEKEEL